MLQVNDCGRKAATALHQWRKALKSTSTLSVKLPQQPKQFQPLLKQISHPETKPRPLSRVDASLPMSANDMCSSALHASSNRA